MGVKNLAERREPSRNLIYVSGPDLTDFFFLSRAEILEKTKGLMTGLEVCVCEKFNSIYLLKMLPTDYAPNLLLPQSDPLKNRVMIIIHFIFFPGIVSLTPPLKPSGRFGWEALAQGESGAVIVMRAPRRWAKCREENLPYVKRFLLRYSFYIKYSL